MMSMNTPVSPTCLRISPETYLPETQDAAIDMSKVRPLQPPVTTRLLT